MKQSDATKQIHDANAKKKFKGAYIIFSFFKYNKRLLKLLIHSFQITLPFEITEIIKLQHANVVPKA